MSFSQPKGGASLLLAFKTQRALIIGGGSLAATRTYALLDADSVVTVLCSRASLCPELEHREQQGQIRVVDWSEIPQSSSASDTVDDSHVLDAYLTSRDNSITLICLTDTLLDVGRRSRASAEQLSLVAKSHGALVNVADMPELSDFAFTTTHRFEDSPLQVGVTTNGQGCRLASRIRREIVTALPKDIGPAVRKVGEMRSLAKEDDGITQDDETCEDATPNRPVAQRSKTDTETSIEAARRRMKWVAQVSEYWPISRLAALCREEMRQVLSGENQVGPEETNGAPTHHNLTLSRVTPKGRILLVGSGPGHPSLLTLATYTALTQLADIVLSDKLVPSAVLELIPKNVTVRIARKFPGNAEGAQMEMMEAAIEAANKGLTVVRLKQGDPVVYGRAGEEVLYFRERGYESVVIPGVSSALAAPTFAGIPVTQRGVAESLVICTGVGRNGKSVQLPGYERGRTLVVLMGVARLAQVVSALVDKDSIGRSGPEYPRHTPIAIIERASMPDQRIIASTLADIEQALQSVGEQRPPGMFVVGWSVLALWAKGDVTVLEDGGAEHDEGRVTRWLGAGQRWRITEGLESGWEGL